MLDCPAYCGARQRMVSRLKVSGGSAAQNDELIRCALFGEGKEHAMIFLRTAMKKRSRILQDDSIYRLGHRAKPSLAFRTFELNSFIHSKKS